MSAVPGPTWTAQRQAMVTTLRTHGIADERILSAMLKVPRHEFIPELFQRASDPYGDHPCPIGHDQTISQPFIVAYMTERMHIRTGEKVLEIGTGSGYQAAILAELGAEVCSIEIVPTLAAHARRVLAEQGYTNVHILTGDGYAGWPDQSPFDVVIVTCAPENIPEALVQQIRDGGRMILPLGAGFQQLVILRKQAGRMTRTDDLPVRFVPMVHGKPGDP